MRMRHGVADARRARNKDQRTAGAPVCFDPWNRRIQPVFFRMCRSAHSDLDEIELKEKCIHPIETADFGAVLYKWELSVYV